MTFALLVVPAPGDRAHRLGRDQDRQRPLQVGPDAQRLGDRRAGARPGAAHCRRRRRVRHRHRAVAAVGRVARVERGGQPADGPRMARGRARSDSSPPAPNIRELEGLHDLRTRSSGTVRFAQFHVWVPADWTVQEAHDRLDRGRGGAAGALPGHRDPDPRRSGRPDRPRDPASLRTSRSKRE